MMNAALRTLLQERITYTPWAGSRQANGAPVLDLSRARSFAARIDDEVRLVLGADGNQRLTSHLVTIDTEGVRIVPEDAITFPDGSTPLIIAAQHVQDPGGTLDHVELYTT